MADVKIETGIVFLPWPSYTVAMSYSILINVIHKRRKEPRL